MTGPPRSPPPPASPTPFALVPMATDAPSPVLQQIPSLARKEPGAAERFVTAYWERAHRTARRILWSDPQAAHSAATDALMTIIRKANTLPAISCEAAYVLRVVANECYAALKRRGGSREVPAGDGMPEPTSHDPSVDALAIRREESLRLWAAVGTLGEIQRQVIELHYVAGLSYEEVAVALDVPVGTVRSRLHAARQQLHSALSAHLPQQHIGGQA